MAVRWMDIVDVSSVYGELIFSNQIQNKCIDPEREIVEYRIWNSTCWL